METIYDGVVLWTDSSAETYILCRSARPPYRPYVVRATDTSVTYEVGNKISSTHFSRDVFVSSPGIRSLEQSGEVVQKNAPSYCNKAVGNAFTHRREGYTVLANYPAVGILFAYSQSTQVGVFFIYPPLIDSNSNRISLSDTAATQTIETIKSIDQNSLDEFKAASITTIEKVQSLQNMIAHHAEAMARHESILEEKQKSSPIIISAPSTKEQKNLPDLRHPVLAKLLQMSMSLKPSKRNFMLIGPMGTGKSYTCEQLAEVLELPSFSTGSVEQAFQLLGYNDAKGEYVPTELYKAMTSPNGAVFTFDEFDGSSPNAMLVINSLAAQGFLDFPCGRVYRPDNFILVATANTWGSGATREFVGRYQQDAATLNRFIKLNYDECHKLECAIVQRDYDRFEEPACSFETVIAMTLFAQEFRRVLQDPETGVRHPVSQRQTYFAVDLLAGGLDFESVQDILFWENMTPSNRRKVENAMRMDWIADVSNWSGDLAGKATEVKELLNSVRAEVA